MKSVLIIKA